ncbi:hypothetical protein NLI96_g10942 [Meripilus lineatus]|uniref:Uncharacterized protein n=1 Tax=Meripilus lineatus TaxID=2056292 RepID=A0AAD5YBG5_9APHY|nr:hypothetical protein NLI96_g10942 [Physisporinus lineatus]
MVENPTPATIHSLTSTLASMHQEQSQSQAIPTQTQVAHVTPQPTPAPTQPPTQQQPPPPPPSSLPIPSLDPNAPVSGTPDSPSKRRPGRPKGSVKKPVDPNAEPKVKRPVGRPRKDGLPAGSVGPKRPAARPRKRPPGTFASGSGPQDSPIYPFPIAPFGEQWPGSISAPALGTLAGRPPAQIPFPIDPSLDRDNWAELLRTRPDIFLHTLVSSLSAPNPISVGGLSVEEAFKSHLASLATANKNATTPAIPTLYSLLRTFWLPSSPGYFSLTASASTSRTPSEHRFLYWDPQPLVFNGIACPACASPLSNKGRIVSGPLKIYDLGKPFFIIGFGRTMSSQPDFWKAQVRPQISGTGLEVWSWRGMGVSIALWNMVRASLRAGLRKDAILGVIRGIVDGVPDEVPWAFPMPAMHPPEAKPNNEGGHKDGNGGGDGNGADEEEEEEVDGNLNGDKEVQCHPRSNFAMPRPLTHRFP